MRLICLNIIIIASVCGAVLPAAALVAGNGTGPSIAYPRSMRQWDRFSKFDHFRHEEICRCTSCHHSKSEVTEEQDCSLCHGLQQNGNRPSLPDAAHKACESCHYEKFKRQGRKEADKTCLACHNARE